MKREKIAILIGIILIAAVGVITFRRAFDFDGKNIPSSASEDLEVNYTNISSKDALTAINDGADLQIIDLDNSIDFEFEHIVDSVNNQYENFDLDMVDPEKEAILIMRERDREKLSKIAKTISDFNEMRVYYLVDGISGWNENGGLVVSWGNPIQPVDQAKVGYIDAQSLNDKLTEGGKIQIVDLRSPSEFNGQRIKGSVNIPIDQLEKRRGNFSLSVPVVFYSSDDLYSFQASVRLYDMRLIPSYVLTGGIANWQELGFDIEQG